MPETVKKRITAYTVKMQLYPNKEQREKIDRIFRALHVAYNITFHEVFQKNPLVCTDPNANGDVWPDFKKITSASWQKHLKEINGIVAEAPAAAIMPNTGLFHTDGKKAWETGMSNRPVNEQMRKDFRFYSVQKPRHSFTVPIDPRKLIMSEENEKVAWVELPKVSGRIKARGFNQRVRFGENGNYTYAEAVQSGIWKEKLTVHVSKDSCGDYFLSVVFSDGKKHERELYLETAELPEERPPVGMDVGIKNIAILSDGQTTIENKHFKKEKDPVLRKLGKQLSGRWGPANEAYRYFNRNIRTENKTREPGEKIPLSEPSKRYLAARNKRAEIERRIARRRDTYYHQQTAMLTKNHSIIAVETLRVKNMLRNHKLAYALTDAAMSDFLSKLLYKAGRTDTRLIPIGTFEPSSQKCSQCGTKNAEVKNLSKRRWKCPKCGAEHDRDVNAAQNILSIALENGAAEDKELETPKKARPQKPRHKPGEHPISEQYPDAVIVYSKELTRINNPRYIIISKKTGETVDNANGAGYKSISNAKNCFIAKKKWSEKEA